MQEKFFPNCTAHERCENCYSQVDCSRARRHAETILKSGTPAEIATAKELIETATNASNNIIDSLNQTAEAIRNNRGTSLNDTLDYGFPAHGCRKVDSKPCCP